MDLFDRAGTPRKRGAGAADDAETTLEGTVERVVYSGGDGAFTVARLKLAGDGAVVTVVEDDPSDANYAPLQANLERLRRLTIKGQPIEIVTLPMPGRIMREGLRLPASYANFYIANESVLLPTFEDPNDAEAIKVMQRAFPERKIVPIDCRELIWGLGAFHCLTQQQPR